MLGEYTFFMSFFLSFYGCQRVEFTIEQSLHPHPQIYSSHLEHKPETSRHVQWSSVRTDLHVRCEAPRGRALEMGDGERGREVG